MKNNKRITFMKNMLIFVLVWAVLGFFVATDQYIAAYYFLIKQPIKEDCLKIEIIASSTKAFETDYYRNNC